VPNDVRTFFSESGHQEERREKENVEAVLGKVSTKQINTKF
jgi:hypothetical protein